MQVQVLYQVRNEITGVIEGFEHVADVNAPEHYDTNRSLEYAFRRCQNIEGSWSMGETIDFDGEPTPNFDYDQNVTVLMPLRTWSDGRKMGHRSSMMYDRMIVDGDIYEVDAFGFRKLED
jgi:hypothetical protein